MTTPNSTTEPDVVDLLLQQHDQIKSMFAQLQTTTGTAKRDLFDELVRLLAVHESAEESVVHPMAKRELDDGEQVVDRRLAEEDEAKKELAELYDMGVDNPEFDRRLVTFAAAVVEHATHEENEEFLRLRASVDADKLRRMAGALKAAEAAAPTRPHANAPESAAGNLMAAPVLGVFDRARDAVRDWHKKNQD